MCQGFYADVVAGMLAPWRHEAALLGWGSDVLGYDTARSTDHGFGPRLLVFGAAADLDPMHAALDRGLPDRYGGHPVRFGWDDVPVAHHVGVHDLSGWLTGQLGATPGPGLSTMDWLATPQQRLLGVVRGAVFADPDGRLRSIRGALGWYPDDLWRWLLACQWRRIEQEESFAGRTAELGDDLGARLLVGRLGTEVMRLAFLYERRYRPYQKWLGTAFSELAIAPILRPVLHAAVRAGDAAEREGALVAAYETMARRHNDSGLTEPIDPTARPFHSRPYRVIGADRFAGALRATVSDPWLRSLPPIGSVDQWADSTDVLDGPAGTPTRAVYAALGGRPPVSSAL